MAETTDATPSPEDAAKKQEEQKRIADAERNKIHEEAYWKMVADKFATIEWISIGEKPKSAKDNPVLEVGHQRKAMTSGRKHRKGGFVDFMYDADKKTITFLGVVKDIKDIHSAMDALAKEGVGKVTLDWTHAEDVDLQMVLDVILQKLKESPPQAVILGEKVQQAINYAARDNNGKVPKEWQFLLQKERELMEKYEREVGPLMKKAETVKKYEDTAAKINSQDPGPADATDQAKQEWKDRMFANANTDPEKLHVMDEKVASLEERSKALDEAKELLKEEQTNGLVEGAGDAREKLLAACEKEQASLDSIRGVLNEEMAKPEYQGIEAQAPAADVPPPPPPPRNAEEDAELAAEVAGPAPPPPPRDDADLVDAPAPLADAAAPPPPGADDLPPPPPPPRDDAPPPPQAADLPPPPEVAQPQPQQQEAPVANANAAPQQPAPAQPAAQQQNAEPAQNPPVRVENLQEKLRKLEQTSQARLAEIQALRTTPGEPELNRNQPRPN